MFAVLAEFVEPPREHEDVCPLCSVPDRAPFSLRLDAELGFSSRRRRGGGVSEDVDIEFVEIQSFAAEDGFPAVDGEIGFVGGGFEVVQGDLWVLSPYLKVVFDVGDLLPKRCGWSGVGSPWESSSVLGFGERRPLEILETFFEIRDMSDNFEGASLILSLKIFLR